MNWFRGRGSTAGLGPSVVILIANVVTFVFAFFMNVALARLLGQGQYGDFKYISNFLMLVPALLGFGVNTSAARLVAMRPPSESDPTVSAALVVGVALSACSVGLLYLAYGLIRLIDAESPAIQTLRILAPWFPFVAVFFLQLILNSVYQGLGSMVKLSLFNIVPYFFMLVAIAGSVGLGVDLGTKGSMGLYVGACLLALVPRLLGLRYSRGDLRGSISLLLDDVRGSGFHVYLSTLVSTAAVQLIPLVFGAMQESAEYGMYALAVSLAGGFRLLASSMATARFRDSAHRSMVRVPDLLVLGAVSFVSWIVYLWFGRRVLLSFYSAEFAGTLDYLNLLALAYLLIGASEYFNRFLVAQGWTQTVLWVSVAYSATLVISSLILGVVYGLRGLAIAALIASLGNLGLYVWTSRRFIWKSGA